MSAGDLGKIYDKAQKGIIRGLAVFIKKRDKC